MSIYAFYHLVFVTMQQPFVCMHVASPATSFAVVLVAHITASYI